MLVFCIILMLGYQIFYNLGVCRDRFCSLTPLTNEPLIQSHLRQILSIGYISIKSDLSVPCG